MYSALLTSRGNWTTLSNAGALTIGRVDNFVAHRLLRFEKRIYIPLPGPEARKRMFELNVGTTPCTLTKEDYRYLAERTNGYV